MLIIESVYGRPEATCCPDPFCATEPSLAFDSGPADVHASPMFLVGSPGRESGNLCEEAAFAPHAQVVVTSALPGDQYAPIGVFWLFAVFKVLLLIYKRAKVCKGL